MQFEDEILVPKARVKEILSMKALLEKENKQGYGLRGGGANGAEPA